MQSRRRGPRKAEGVSIFSRLCKLEGLQGALSGAKSLARNEARHVLFQKPQKSLCGMLQYVVLKEAKKKLAPKLLKLRSSSFRNFTEEASSTQQQTALAEEPRFLWFSEEPVAAPCLQGSARRHQSTPTRPLGDVAICCYLLRVSEDLSTCQIQGRTQENCPSESCGNRASCRPPSPPPSPHVQRTEKRVRGVSLECSARGKGKGVTVAVFSEIRVTEHDCSFVG